MDMDKEKRRRLESAGWRVGDVAEFLELSPAEAEFVELKLALAMGLRARREEPAGELPGDAGTVCGVLAVEDAKVDRMLLAQVRQSCLDSPAPRGAEDVGDEEQPQGSARSAAGCTSRWTC